MSIESEYKAAWGREWRQVARSDAQTVALVGCERCWLNGTRKLCDDCNNRVIALAALANEPNHRC